MKALINMIIFIIVWVLAQICMLIGIVYTLIKSIRVKGILREYFYFNSFTTDQSLNVMCKHPLNDWFVYPDGYRFGNPDETISYVLGVNQYRKKLYLAGRGLVWLVDFIFFITGKNKWRDHCSRAKNNPDKN